ncbi:MAG: hypothetical protein QM783_09340 [Phycisphaerales bacterium]
MRASTSTGHSFLVDGAGFYHLNPAMGSDLYATARHADSIGRTAHFLGLPLFDRYWGAWVWTGWSGSGAGRSDVPSPTKEQFAPAAANMSALEMMPGLDYVKVAVPGGPYDQTIWYTGGVVTLLATSYVLAGPVSAAVLIGGASKLRRRHRAQCAAAGQCPICAFDRKGISANAACPECGTTV